MLRAAALPAWYAATMIGLAVTFLLMQYEPVAGTAVWIGVVCCASALLFALELGARRWLAVDGEEDDYLRAQSERVRRGYSWRRRLGFLGDAVFCWMISGTATVLVAQRFGAWLASLTDFFAAPSAFVGASPAALRIFVAFVALDAWSYARHRLEHARGERGLLWRWVHRRHHEPTDIDLWTGMVVHPVEAVLVFAAPCTLFAALGFAAWELLFLFTVFLMITMPQHMNSGWDAGEVVGALIMGPEAHARHHSADPHQRNANYADCLTIWDRIFGTYARPPRGVFHGPFGGVIDLGAIKPARGARRSSDCACERGDSRTPGALRGGL